MLSYFCGVASECGDISLHPLKGDNLVLNTEISLCLALDIEKSQSSETIINRHHNHVGLDKKSAVVQISRKKKKKKNWKRKRNEERWGSHVSLAPCSNLPPGTKNKTDRFARGPAGA